MYSTREGGGGGERKFWGGEEGQAWKKGRTGGSKTQFPLSHGVVRGRSIVVDVSVQEVLVSDVTDGSVQPLQGA